MGGGGGGSATQPESGAPGQVSKEQTHETTESSWCVSTVFSVRSGPAPALGGIRSRGSSIRFVKPGYNSERGNIHMTTRTTALLARQEEPAMHVGTCLSSYTSAWGKWSDKPLSFTSF